VSYTPRTGQRQGFGRFFVSNKGPVVHRVRAEVQKEVARAAASEREPKSPIRFTCLHNTVILRFLIGDDPAKAKPGQFFYGSVKQGREIVRFLRLAHRNRVDIGKVLKVTAPEIVQKLIST